MLSSVLTSDDGYAPVIEKFPEATCGVAVAA